MADHAWTQENLDAYVLGGLSVQERSRLERHVDSCSECAHAKSEISEMEQLMDGIFTRVRPDAGLEDRAIQHLRQARRPRPNWFRFVTAAAAVFVFGTIGLVVQMFAFDGTLPLPGMAAGERIEPVAARFPFNGLAGAFSEHKVGASTGGKVYGMLSVPEESKEGKPEPDSDMISTHDLIVKLKVDDGDEELKDKGRYGKYMMHVTPAVTAKPTPDGESKESVKKALDDLDTQARFYERGDKAPGRDKATKDPAFFELPDLNKNQNSTKPGDGRVQQQFGLMYKLTEKAKEGFGDGADKKAEEINKDLKDLAEDKGKLLAQMQVPSPPKGIQIPPGPLDKSPAGGNGGISLSPSIPINPTGQPAPTTSPPPGVGYFAPIAPPPVQVASSKEKKGTKGEDDEGAKGGDQKPGGEGKPSGERQEKPDDGGKPKPGKTEEQPKVEPKGVATPDMSGRKIIRTGEMDFETDSFDNSVTTINKLIFDVKGGFIATINSDKLPNGKTKGSIIVRMPPQFLDKFIFDLRRELGKTGELKNQRLGSLDVSKQFTDTESRLRAARAIEERLINIIKTGKGEIKDLVAAERELGVWRTKIEEMEGEIRYYNNQVSLSTLTISISEKEIQSPTAIVVTETVTVRIEVDEVAKGHQIVMKAIEEMKGRITRSELKQHTAGQFTSIIHADIPPAKKDGFVKQLEKLGLVSDFQENQRQHTEGGTGRATDLKPKQSDVRFEITMHNNANIRPRLSADLKVATTDVAAAYTKLLEAITKAKGQIRDGKLNEQDKLNIHATIDFNVPTSEKATIDKLLEEIGPTLERINIRAPVSEVSTERKFGYTLLLRDFASIPPRQAIVEVVATLDVQTTYAKLQEAVAKVKGAVADARLNEQDKNNISAHLEFTVPGEEMKAMQKLIEELGTVLSRNNVQTPVHQLATTKKFGFSLVLRDFNSVPPSKASDLKVATNDVPSSYQKLLDAITKAKGQLVDAKLNEHDKFNITAQIEFSVQTDEKNTIDKLLAELGTILSRSNVQVPMNQLAIAKKFGYSVTLRDFATILPSHASDVKIAANDVPGNYAKLVDAVVKAKGHLRTSRLNEQDKLNITAVLDFSVPTTEKAGIDKLLSEIGTTLSRNNVQAPMTELTTERKFGYSIVIRDIAAIPPRETFHVQIAAIDVPAAFRELQEAVAAARGLVTVGQLTEDSKVKMEARFEFDINAQDRANIENVFKKVGAVLARTSSQVNVNELATDQKVGYKLFLRSTAAIGPRETVNVKIEVKDVDTSAADLKAIVAATKGRIIDSNIDRLENGEVLGVMKIEIPFASQDALLKQVKGVARRVVSQKAARSPSVPENELATSHIIVVLAGVSPIVPANEGLGSYISSSLYMSFRVFAICLMLIILGVSAVLPWALVIWVVYKVYSRFSAAREVQFATATGPTPPPSTGTAPA